MGDSGIYFVDPDGIGGYTIIAEGGIDFVDTD
ncbi:hypothetical protein ES703_50867 [subsurface metagenome]